MIDFERVKEMVEDVDGLAGLFMWAAETERSMPRAYDLRVKGCWPEVTPDRHLAYGYNEVEVRRGPASARDVTCYDVALELTKLMPVEDARIVWGAAHSAVGRQRGIAWTRLGKMLGMHPQTVKRRFESAVLDLWYKILYAC